MTFKALVLDDEDEQLKDWCKKIRKVAGVQWKVEPIEIVEFNKQLRVLRDRQTAARSKMKTTADCAFDTIDLLIVDYDLANTGDNGLLVTGEEVSYLCRTQSQCGPIIGLNFGSSENEFDLSLKDKPESFADLNISSGQIAYPGLWSTKRTGLRPWSWPVASSFVDNFELSCGDLEKNLRKPILKILEFPQAAIESLPRAVVEFLGDKGVEADTFDIVFSSVLGLRGKEQTAKIKLTEKQLARIAAARIRKWLEFVVLPRQDVLVDAPHLVTRFPSLLAGNAAKADSWNRLAQPDSALKQLGMRPIPRTHQLAKSHWLSKPVWFWKTISQESTIREVSQPWKSKNTGFVFCEDTSLFTLRAEAREFVADTDSVFARRHVKGGIDKVQYHPSMRFSA